MTSAQQTGPGYPSTLQLQVQGGVFCDHESDFQGRLQHGSRRRSIAARDSEEPHSEHRPDLEEQAAREKHHR